MVKKTLLFMALNTTLFSNEILITQNIGASIQVKPTIFQANFFIKESENLHKIKNLATKDKNTIIETYNTINLYLQKDSICKGGNFDISPVYSYNPRKLEGYQTNFNATCKFKEMDSKKFNEVLNYVENITKENRFLTFSIPKIVKILDENVDYAEQLNNKILEVAIKKSKTLSKTLQKKCYLKEVNLIEENFNQRIANADSSHTLANAKNTKESLNEIILPTQENITKKAKAKVTFSCK